MVVADESNLAVYFTSKVGKSIQPLNEHTNILGLSRKDAPSSIRRRSVSGLYLDVLRA